MTPPATPRKVLTKWREDGMRKDEIEQLMPGATTNSHATENDPATPIPSNDATWPVPDPAVFHGLAGTIVNTIDPYTEADPMAGLTNLLVGFGNLIGAGPHFMVERTKHALRLFACCVGDTSKARKGTSISSPFYVLKQLDPGWAARVTSGLSSGEGLINAVRDERTEQQPVKQGGKVVGYQQVVVDPGVTDKRLCLVEEEFVQALKVMSREGNILSPTLRQAWDHGDLNPLTKTTPIRATGAHISIIGHITRQELLRHLSETEQANGFANRFLWVAVRRSKEIPEPTGAPEIVLDSLVEKLEDAFTFAKTVGEMKRDQEGRHLWRSAYHELSQGKPGLIGSMLARGEAQVMRLACLYALLDYSAEVRADHLRAAMGFWCFAEKSTHRIFSGRLGDPVADRILATLRATGELTMTAIGDVFGRHRNANEISTALDLLQGHGLAKSEVRQTNGRPVTVWKLGDSSSAPGAGAEAR